MTGTRSRPPRAQAVYRQLVNPRVRLVDSDLLNESTASSKWIDLGALYGGLQHRRGAVGKYCVLIPACFSRASVSRTSGKASSVR